MPRSIRPGHHRATSRNREHVLNRHQKITVNRALGLRNVRVHRLNQLHHARYTNVRIVALKGLQRRSRDDRRVVTRKLVGRQQVAYLHLHQLQQLLVVNLVCLVHVNHDVRNTHLPRQQYVLARLRHRSVRRTHHQDRTVHLGRSRDHVLHVVRVPRTVYVRVVTVRTLVLHVRRRNRYPALALLRGIVNLVVRRNLTSVLLRHHLRQCRRQGRLAMVNVTNRPDVYMRLRSLKFLFRHVPDLSRFVFCSQWSPHPDLNRGPLPYQGSALPLSYVGRIPVIATLASLWSG